MIFRPLIFVSALLLAGTATAQDVAKPESMDQCRTEHAAAADDAARAAAARTCSGRVVDACKAGPEIDACLRTAAGLWIRFSIFYDAERRVARGEPRDLAIVRAGHGYPKLLQACPKNDFVCALTAIVPTALDRMAAADATK